MEKVVKAVVAIASITILELYALYQGVDGQALSLAVGAIAGLGGYILTKVTGSKE